MHEINPKQLLDKIYNILLDGCTLAYDALKPLIIFALFVTSAALLPAILSNIEFTAGTGPYVSAANALVTALSIYVLAGALFLYVVLVFNAFFTPGSKKDRVKGFQRLMNGLAIAFVIQWYVFILAVIYSQMRDATGWFLPNIILALVGVWLVFSMLEEFMEAVLPLKPLVDSIVKRVRYHRLFARDGDPIAK